MAKSATMVRCDYCYGPAKWTVILGEMYFHCESQCDGFMQMELFGEERVSPVVRGDDAATTGVPSNPKKNRQWVPEPTDDFPF